MTITIIEDEPLAARHLLDLLREVLPEAILHGPLPSVQEAIQYFGQHPAPDLIFSDIELLDGNVFALFDRVSIACPVIFTTAYDQFLLRAFQGNGIAYLLKPFHYEQVSKALAKYDGLKNQFGATPQPPAEPLTATVIQQLREALQPAQNTYRQRFTVKLRQGIVLLSTDDIACLQTDESVVFAYDSSGRKYPLNGTLTELENQLNPAQFFRINRGDIINVRHIERIESYGGDRLAIRVPGQAQALVASTARTPELRRWLDR
ncbi:MAG: DNA-binding response regulator [Cytophagales bacterium]|nr:MAG: DNA-binding response regulator [Cytophagales bacterium]